VRFEATLERRGSGHLVALPFDAREAFGRVRAPVRATVAGHAFRTTTVRYGGVDYIGLNREVRQAARVGPDDRFEVELEPDTEPRVVDVPRDLTAAVGRDARAEATFESLSYTHRKEYARWITEARREETRARRLEKAVVLLRDGVRTPG